MNVHVGLTTSRSAPPMPKHSAMLHSPVSRRRLLSGALPIIAALASAGPAQAASSLPAGTHARTAPKRQCTRHHRRGRRPCVTRRRAARQVLAWTGNGTASGSSRTTATAGCPDAHLMPAAANLGRVSAATLCLVNQQRHSVGERALSDNATLDRAAGAHSDDMVARNYFSHTGPDGTTLLSRLAVVGYQVVDGGSVAENIGWSTGMLATPADIVASWMSSPDHRANILNPSFRMSGIGVTPGAAGLVVPGRAAATYAQDFGVDA
jgi:uncharacterized protein YkwD